MNNNKLEILVTAKDTASSVIKGVGNSFDDLSKSAVAGSRAMLIGVAAVGAGVAAFGVSSAKAYIESENALAQLNAVLASTKGAAGIGSAELLTYATSLQRVTTFSDEAIQGVESMLLTFTSLKGPLVKDATKTVLDMSTALGQDTKSSAIMLGKALQDPIMGVSALRRVGVNFSQAQQDVIKNLVDTNQVAKAQALIMKELQTEFGGSAEAAGKTFAGRLTILKNTFGDLQESVGQLILAGITPLIMGFQKFIDNSGGFEGIVTKLKDAMAAIQPYFPAITGAIIGGLLPAVIALGVSIWTTMAPLLPFIAIGTALGVIINALVQHFGGWNAVLGILQGAMSQFWGMMQDALAVLMPSLTALWNTLSTQLWPALMNLWNVVGPLLLPILKELAIAFGVGLVVSLYLVINVLNIVAGVITWLVNLLTGLINVVRGVIGWFGSLAGTITVAMSGVYNALVTPFQMAMNFISQLPARIVNSIGNLGQLLHDKLGNIDIPGPLGKVKDVIPGFANGVRNFSGGLAVVGERGPELVNLPRGSNVYSNSASQGMMGGGGVHIEIHGNIVNETADAANAFFDRLNRQAELAGQGLAL